jgi:hypothetical protein
MKQAESAAEHYSAAQQSLPPHAKTPAKTSPNPPLTRNLNARTIVRHTANVSERFQGTKFTEKRPRKNRLKQNRLPESPKKPGNAPPCNPQTTTPGKPRR